jgi:hypothetical protein
MKLKEIVENQDQGKQTRESIEGLFEYKSDALRSSAMFSNYTNYRCVQEKQRPYCVFVAHPAVFETVPVACCKCHQFKNSPHLIYSQHIQERNSNPCEPVLPLRKPLCPVPFGRFVT